MVDEREQKKASCVSGLSSGGFHCSGAHGGPNSSLRKLGSVENNPKDTKVGDETISEYLFLALLELNIYILHTYVCVCVCI